MHKLHSETGTTKVPDDQIFSLIFKKVLEETTSNSDLTLLSEDFAQNFNRLTSEFLLDYSIKDLYKILFLSGYYYKVFLTKNNAQIVRK